MNISKILVLVLSLTFLLTACKPATQPNNTEPVSTTAPQQSVTAEPIEPDSTVPQMEGTVISLSDDAITVDGQPISTDAASPVYTAKDIVYYEAGKDFTYGEGTEQDAHTREQATAHTVVHITQPGTYTLSGRLSLGQIAVDLGKDAKKDPQAVVTLVLNGVDITCQVAPAVIFYNVYECGNDDTETATKDVNTSAAGANVILADGTVNTVNGSYVARIYEPESVVLNDSKTEVEDADKLHKYDGAFYSKRSMNISGNTGILNINAENEGLDSEMHLTINGGNINIQSGNDGINTNEDGVSVTTVNGGKLTIRVTGDTGEGDGIDSNGWLVINGGTVIAAACSRSADAGIDSDMGIHILGGTVIATGHMLDRIEEGGQNYAVLNFAQNQTGSETVAMKDLDGNMILETKPENTYSIMIYSSPELQAGTYTLWSDGQQLACTSGGMMGGMQPGGIQPSHRPDNTQYPFDEKEPPEGFTRPESGNPPPEGFTPPDGGNFPEGGKFPEDGTLPDMPGNFQPGRPNENNPGSQDLTPDFIIVDGGNQFGSIQPLK